MAQNLVSLVFCCHIKLRIQKAFFVPIILLGLSLAGCSNDVPLQLPKLPPDAIILAYGDSLTRGVGVDGADSYPRILAGLIDREVVNGGESGETSVQGLLRLPGVLDKIKPDLLILIHGGNDFLRHLSEAELKQNLSKMIDLAMEKGISVIMLSVPKPSILLRPAKLYSELATQFQLPIDESSLTDVLKDAKLKSDVLHPNAAGNRHIAQKIKLLLVEVGAI